MECICNSAQFRFGNETLSAVNEACARQGLIPQSVFVFLLSSSFSQLTSFLSLPVPAPSG